MYSSSHLFHAKSLHQAWKAGLLGGELMPEDAKPTSLSRRGEATLAYFTLPMALNYQRNSYKLWEAATQTWLDESTRWVFDPCTVVKKDFVKLQASLLKHKLALQPNKHSQTWFKICASIATRHHGCFELLLHSCHFDIGHIKKTIQKEEKACFPYLSGMKICNYWLYVLIQYTDYPFSNLSEISIAPDTHVIQASHKLGIVSDSELKRADVQILVDKRWREILYNSDLTPIDMHTPLWLWSRAGFPQVQ